MDELITKVEQWAKDKGLDQADPKAQFLKVAEEFGEIASAMARSNDELFKDSVGDVIVTLIILSMQKGTNVQECLEMAYNEIKGRTGKMVDGVFVKSSDLKQLDEPKKPVVPKFVAEWFEENKDDLEFEIWDLCVDSYGSKDEYGMLNWIQQSENNPIETLIRMKDGYEVEKEPLYTVTINLDLKYHLVVDEGDGNDEIITTLTTTDGVFGYRYFLTEKEIKSADENLWKFAVPVEEVAEG